MSFHSSLTGTSLHESKITTGAGAPGSTPSYVGQSYFDTTNKVFYVATGTSIPGDWKATTVPAGFDASLIADGSVSNAEFQFINSLTSNAQTQLTTNATAISDHLADSVDAHDASAISNVPSGNLAATDVQAALNELQTDVDSRALNSSLTSHTGASSGVHGVTGSVVGTSDSQTLTNKTIDFANNTASNINSISGTVSVAKGGTGLTALGSALQVLRVNASGMELEYVAAGSGDVVGPASSTSGRVAVYNGTSGKLLQDGTKLEADLVTGPASSTDNAIARFDFTTGKLIQNSGATIDDSDQVSAASFTATGGTAANNTIYVASNSLRLRGGTSGLAFYNTSGTENFSQTDVGTASWTTTSGHNVILKKSTGASIQWQAGASAAFSIDNNSGTMRVLDNGGTERFSVTQAGVASCPGGIIIGGNETLSTYDEATWTVTLTGSGSNPTRNTNYGRYTRIGNMVMAEITIAWGSGGSTGSGSYTLNLPIAPAAGNHRVVGVGHLFKTASGWIDATIEANAGSTTATLFCHENGSVIDQYVSATDPYTWDNGDYFVFQITYRV